VEVTLAMMAYQEKATNAGFTGVKQVGVVRHVAAAKFDLPVMIADTPAGLLAEFEYATQPFDETTIRALMTRFGRVLEAALTHPHLATDALAIYDLAL
jgi:non-ribosomal peptide synthetase component F